ncbi:hypothetical protein ACN262_05715 [Burkholderia gladioli]|uniref:hypothetical protein n=1 Tax=Burkholderia gladioli TaxID=28095 RepID=UPI00163F80E1|nr:hypothetical protein [Burkholderia gladioli]
MRRVWPSARAAHLGPRSHYFRRRYRDADVISECDILTPPVDSKASFSSRIMTPSFPERNLPEFPKANESILDDKMSYVFVKTKKRNSQIQTFEFENGKFTDKGLSQTLSRVRAECPYSMTGKINSSNLDNLQQIHKYISPTIKFQSTNKIGYSFRPAGSNQQDHSVNR